MTEKENENWIFITKCKVGGVRKKLSSLRVIFSSQKG